MPPHGEVNSPLPRQIDPPPDFGQGISKTFPRFHLRKLLLGDLLGKGGKHQNAGGRLFPGMKKLPTLCHSCTERTWNGILPGG